MALSHKPQYSGLLPTLFSAFFLLALATRHQAQSATESVSFSFTDFTQNDERLTLQGTAEIVDGTLALTNRQKPTWTTGRALYYTAIPIWDKATGNVASFTASFDFIVDSYPQAKPADGIVFFLAPEDATEIPPNSGGGALGVINSNTAFNNFVGVEFDSYSNEYDPSFPHIGIDVNSLISLRTVKWDRADGSLVSVSIIYDGPSNILSVAATYPNGEIATVAQVVDLKAVLPEKARIGLSATTTESRERHDIYKWSFTSRLETGKSEILASYA